MRARIAATLLVAMVLAPSASAGHWTFYRTGLDTSVGDTLEDDGAIFRLPGTVLDARVNRIVPPTDEPGDGSLFLDARFAIGGRAIDIHAYDAFAAAFDRPNFVAPGERHLAAWYGWWQDRDADGAIQDLDDRQCGEGFCDADEFLWRGISSGHAVAILVARTPGGGTQAGLQGEMRPVSDTVFVNRAEEPPYTLGRLDDRTNGNDQGWTGFLEQGVEGGFLGTEQTLVLADAKRAVGGALDYDIEDPEALIDVDVYESLHPDVAVLWSSSASTVVGVVVPTVKLARGLPGLGIAALFDAVEPVMPMLDPWALLNDPVDAVRRAQDTTIAAPPVPREPNEALDDFEGRATYGGVGDAQGSYNAYPAYATGFHLYLDAVPRFYACQGSSVPPTPYSAVACTPGGENAVSAFEPRGYAGPGERSASLWTSFTARYWLWHDVNGDGYVGNVCDPSNATQFDVDRNACRNPPTPWPHNPTRPEIISICEAARLRGTTFTVEPIGGTWEGVILARDQHDALAGEPGTRFETLTGSATISLRWQDACTSGVESRDALIFTRGGASVPLKVVSLIELDGYVDVEAGITLDAERVLDVDILPANL